MTRALRLGILATHPIQYFTALYRELAARPGVDLTVFYAHRPDPVEQGVGFGVPFEWDVDLTSGYRHVWLHNRAARPSATRFDGCDTPAIAGEILPRRFDAFLVMGWHARSYWQAMRACWRTGTPVLVRGDSQLATDASVLKRAVKRAGYPLFLRRFTACLAVGSRSEEYFRYYGARRIVRSPHFVDNAAFARAAAEWRPRRKALRAEWGIPADAVVVLFAGKLVPKKRPADVVRAVASLGRADVHVLVAGDGELRSELANAAGALRVPLRFTGFLNQTEIPRAYAAADLLALPSDARETWGLVVNEAMACGLPVVVSRGAGCSADLVTPGVTGYTHEVGDVSALALALRQLAGDQRLRQRMGADAAHRVSSYDVSAAADGVMDGALAGVAA